MGQRRYSCWRDIHSVHFFCVWVFCFLRWFLKNNFVRKIPKDQSSVLWQETGMVIQSWLRPSIEGLFPCHFKPCLFYDIWLQYLNVVLRASQKVCCDCMVEVEYCTTKMLEGNSVDCLLRPPVDSLGLAFPGSCQTVLTVSSDGDSTSIWATYFNA